MADAPKSKNDPDNSADVSCIYIYHMIAAFLSELCYYIQFVYILSVNTTKFATKRIAVDLLI